MIPSLKLGKHEFLALRPEAARRNTITIKRNTHRKERLKTKWERFVASLDDNKRYTFYTIKKDWQQYVQISGADIRQFKQCKSKKYSGCFVNPDGVLLYIEGYSIYLHKLINDRKQTNAHPYYSIGEKKYDPQRIVIDEFGGNMTSEAMKSKDNRLHHVGINGYKDYTSTSLLSDAQHKGLHSLAPIPRNNLEDTLKNLPSLKKESRIISKMENTSPKIILAKSEKKAKDCDMADLTKIRLSEEAAQQFSELFKAVYPYL